MGLQLMDLHTVMGNVWLAGCCSHMETSLTSDKWTDRRSREGERGREGRKEGDLGENRMISHLISQTLIYRRFHKRERAEGKRLNCFMH